MPGVPVFRRVGIIMVVEYDGSHDDSVINHNAEMRALSLV